MSGLDALWEKGGNLPDVVTPALDELKRHGITHPDEELTDRIRLALTHRSFLYENQDLLPGITPAHLDALTTLGSTFMRRALAISAYQRFGDISSGLLSREVNHIGTLVPVWAAKAHWLHAAALLGKGLAGGELPKKVTTSLFHQLLGVLCLSGEATAAEGLVAELHQEPTSPGIADPKTTLQEMMTGKSLRYEYSRTGPDHSATFSAVVTDEAGRYGAGSGNSKKAAGQAAAWAFIETYCLHLLPTAPAPTGSHSPNPITSVAAHEKIVFRLQELFSLPDSARGLLSQALIHQSWAYEHAKVIQEARQRDNQVLAYLGSVTTNYEYTRSVAISVLNDRSMSDHGINTQRNETYADAFYRTESVMGFLLGRGMARESSISLTVASDAFKAIVGAVFVANRYPVTLGDVWPDAWKLIWDLIASGQARPVSARERLDKLAALSQLSLEYRIETQGPDHARQFRAIADLDSAVLGRLVTITSSFESSKDLAREHCAARLITLFDALGTDTPHAITESMSLVQFLVTHLATVFAANPECREIWARKRLLGLHLVHSNAQLLAWAEAVSTLIDVGLEPSLVHELAAAYATAMGNTLEAGQGEIGALSPGSVGSLADAVRVAITRATSAVEAEASSGTDGE